MSDPSTTPAPLVSRRQYLVMRAIHDSDGSAPFIAVVEAVTSTALAHPEWDMDERRTWAQWWGGDQ